MCGFKRPALSVSQPLSVAPDISVMHSRLGQLQGIALSSAYAKQKNSLKKEFSTFLASLPGNKTLSSATPTDVCRFLAWKDSWGKTQVHVTACPHLGKHSVHSCGCPVRLSYATVDSYIGKLWAIFKEAGREGDWNTPLGLGNPAASTEVKAYLKAFTSGQLRAAVTPKQATPLFLVKVVQLSRLIQVKCQFLALLLPSFLCMRETLLCLRRSFSAAIEQMILPWLRPKRLCGFRKTMVSCSITSGVNPSGMAPLIFSAFVAIPICRFALLRP